MSALDKARIPEMGRRHPGDRRRLAPFPGMFLANIAYVPSLEIKPEQDAKRLAASALFERGRVLTGEGKVEEAVTALDSALDISPTLDITSTLTATEWNSLCRNGTLAGAAAMVMPACERAVASDSEDGDIRDSRGLARALLGDIEGAIVDFEFYVTWVEGTGWTGNVDWREAWIAALKAAENPFDEATLDALRAE